MGTNPFHTSPFRQFGANTTITGIATSVSGALARAADQTAIVSNSSTTLTAFVRFGTAAVAATAADMPVLPGQQIALDIPATATHAAVICSGAGPTAVYISVGDGSQI